MRLRRVRHLIALVLIVSILSLRIGALSHFVFVEPIQNFIAKKAFIQEDTTRHKVTFFKIKRALHDFTSSTEGPLLPPHLPPVTTLRPAEPFRAVPEVYLDIFRPPDNLG